MNVASALVIPCIVLAVGLIMLRRGSAFDSFLRGAREGLRTTAELLPVMVMLTVALSMFTASGAAELIASVASPVCTRLGVPAEVLPLAITRVVSGSAASASFANLLESEGADSLAGVTAALIMGSTDTLVYVVAVYFGRTRVKRAARALVISLLVAVLCLFLSSFLARLFFT